MSSALVPAAERHILHTGVPETAARLERIELLPATNRLQLAIGLPLRNQAALTNLLHELYSTRSTNFHRFLTPAQFVKQFGPTEQEYQDVMAYARSNRLKVVGIYGNRALLEVAGSVADINQVFQVHLGLYQHPAENRQFFAPDTAPSVEPGLPILYVSGLDNYAVPHHDGRVVPRPEGGSDPNNPNLYMGADFRNAYVPGTTLTGAGQVVGVFSLSGYTTSDVQTYEASNGLPSVPLINVLGNLLVTTENSETASDIELVIAMAPGLDAVNVYEGTSPESIMNEIVSTNHGEVLPYQVTCSWDIFALTNLEPALIQMAAQGQTFLKASGDGGAYPNGVDSDTDQNYLYMTGVGGTKLVMNGAGASWNSETVWNDGWATNDTKFGSTGGILTRVPIPDYQKSVSMALNKGSTQYRNVPDVAMVARDIGIVHTFFPTSGPPVSGTFSDWHGTSAASPLFAGFVALVNQQAAAEGKPPVGFLNPALYDIAEGPLYAICFHDITTGNNSWTNTVDGTTSGDVYYATTGYDLCTGWGTPSGTNLIYALAGLSGPVFVDFNYTGGTGNGSYDAPFKTMADATNAVSQGGTIIIKTAGSSSATMLISKRMTITASDGVGTLGR